MIGLEGVRRERRPAHALRLALLDCIGERDKLTGGPGSTDEPNITVEELADHDLLSWFTFRVMGCGGRPLSDAQLNIGVGDDE